LQLEKSGNAPASAATPCECQTEAQMPVPELRLLPLREAAHRVADRSGVSTEDAKVALDRAFREHSLVPVDSNFSLRA